MTFYSIPWLNSWTCVARSCVTLYYVLCHYFHQYFWHLFLQELKLFSLYFSVHFVLPPWSNKRKRVLMIRIVDLAKIFSRPNFGYQGFLWMVKNFLTTNHVRFHFWSKNKIYHKHEIKGTFGVLNLTRTDKNWGICRSVW